MRATIAHAEGFDGATALAERLIASLQEQRPLIRPDILIVWSTIELEHEVLLKALLAPFEGARLIGCSTSAEISSQRGVVEVSVVVAALEMEGIAYGLGVGEDAPGDPQGAVARAVAMAREQLGAAEQPTLCLTLPETFRTNLDKVADYLNDELKRRALCRGRLRRVFR